MKLKLMFSKVLTSYIIGLTICGLMLLGVFFRLFFLTTWDFRQYLILGIWLGLALLFMTLTFNGHYYILKKDKVIEVRFKKQFEYKFSDILYIDEPKSLKSKTICFYTNKGHSRYLVFDQEGKILQEMIKHSPNLLSKEEFEINYPGIKL